MENTHEIRLHEHVTDGGAIYLTTVKNDLSTSVVRLDGKPILIVNTEILKKALKDNQ